jgi:hypothetical protein
MKQSGYGRANGFEATLGLHRRRWSGSLALDAARYVTGVALPADAGMTAQPPGISPSIGQRIRELSQ